MNHNFEQTRKILLADADTPTNWQFLSISFDPNLTRPKFWQITPGFYRGNDTNRWLFAAASTNVLAEVAPRLDLMVMRQGNNISHNMRTVVLDTQGKISRQLDGNQWTSQQLADAIVQAARGQTNSTP